MNIVLFITDSYRRDNLGCYGGDATHTPRLDAFAEGAHVFDNCFVGSFPTVPHRMDVMTGKMTHTFARWQPLPPDKITIQQVLGRSGIKTMLCADTPHILQHGFNYSRGFDGFEWIRGQENDHWRTYPREVTLPCPADKLRSPDYTMVHYLRNTYGREDEADFFTARTVRAACDWLDRNADDGPFFLHVDTFTPHEPWDPPAHDLERYAPDYDGESVTYPRYDEIGYLSDDELAHCHARYRGEATHVDRQFGVLLDKLEEAGIADDTVVIFTTDHGFLFGEQGRIGKAHIPPGGIFQTLPFYREVAHIPLLIHMPGQTEQHRLSALVQPWDFMPTVLELFDIIATEAIGGTNRVQVLQCGVYEDRSWRLEPGEMHGRSLLPLIRGDSVPEREIAITSASLLDKTAMLSKSAIVSADGWWLYYSGAYDEDTSGFVGPIEPALYHYAEDPDLSENLIEDEKDRAEAMHAAYVAELERVGTAEDYLAPRRELWRNG